MLGSRRCIRVNSPFNMIQDFKRVPKCGEAVRNNFFSGDVPPNNSRILTFYPAGHSGTSSGGGP